MANFTILAFDPGGTTGWALFQADRIVTPDSMVEYYNVKHTCGHLGPEPHHKRLYDFMGYCVTETTHFVTESFEYRNRERPGLELISREYIGVMRYFGEERTYPIIQQTASQGKITDKSFVRKGNLQKLGLWETGFKHAMDARGHLLYYMINNVHVMRDELLQKGWK